MSGKALAGGFEIHLLGICTMAVGEPWSSGGEWLTWVAASRVFLVFAEY